MWSYMSVHGIAFYFFYRREWNKFCKNREKKKMEWLNEEERIWQVMSWGWGVQNEIFFAEEKIKEQREIGKRLEMTNGKNRANIRESEYKFN